MTANSIVDLNPLQKSRIYLIKPTKLRDDLPLFIFLPGMDGTGQLLRVQIPNLVNDFDIRCLSIPPDDQSDWKTLVHKTLKLIEAEIHKNPKREVYLCGESFGGCLALQVALRAQNLLHRLILVNPASSFKQRPWVRWGAYLTQWLPDWFYPGSVLGLLPFLASLGRIGASDRHALLNAMRSVPQKTSVLRLELLHSFSFDENLLRQIQIPVLVIASGADRLLPSVLEGQYLTKILPNGDLVVLPDSGHACLLEIDVDLGALIKEHSAQLNPTKLLPPALDPMPSH